MPHMANLPWLPIYFLSMSVLMVTLIMNNNHPKEGEAINTKQQNFTDKKKYMTWEW